MFRLSLALSMPNNRVYELAKRVQPAFYFLKGQYPNFY